MKKIILTTMMTAVALSAVTPSSIPASAATKVKVKSGKLVNASTGKVVKGTIVYKKRLYKNGVLAKGTILHKNILYVNGKVKSGVVPYKKKFYKKGKLIGKNMYFLYKDKLYVNNKIAKGEKLYRVYGMDYYYKNGVLSDGTYKNNYYRYGELFFSGKVAKPYDMADNNVTYSTDGSTVTYTYRPYYSLNMKVNKSKVVVSPKATVKSAKVVNGAVEVTLSNVKKNTIYNLKIKEMKVEGYPLTFSTKFSGLPDGVKKYNFTELNAAYNTYKNMKPAELKKFLQSTEGKEITAQLAKGENYMKTFNYERLTAAQFAYDSVHTKLSELIEDASYDYE